MGYYQYCRNCHGGVGAPEITDFISGEQVCPHCGDCIEVNKDQMLENALFTIKELEERVEKLEHRLKGFVA